MTPSSPLQRGSFRPFLPPARKAGARCSPARPGPFSSLTVANRPCRCTLAGLRVPSFYTKSVHDALNGAPDGVERIRFLTLCTPLIGKSLRAKCPAKPHVLALSSAVNPFDPQHRSKEISGAKRGFGFGARLYV